jgi:hypothetical protein
MREQTEIVMPTGELRTVEGRMDLSLLSVPTVDGVEYGVSRLDGARCKHVDPAREVEAYTPESDMVRVGRVYLRRLGPGEAMMRKQSREPAPAPVVASPRARIARLFVHHEDVSPSDDVVVVVRRGVPRQEWARQLRRLADAEVAEGAAA